MKSRKSALAIGSLLLLVGCGLANHRSSYSWTARLEKIPNPDCVRGAIGSIPLVIRMRDESIGTRQVLTVFLSADDPYPGIMVIMAGPPAPAQFEMHYADYERLGRQREQVARAIVNGVAKACGVPELSERAKETHDLGWNPYLFNI